jgi:hypothetical protein
MFRLLEINFVNSQQLYPVHLWEYDNFNDIHLRKIQIVYKLSNRFEIILFGFDGTKKWNIIENELKERIPGRNKNSL